MTVVGCRRVLGRFAKPEDAFRIEPAMAKPATLSALAGIPDRGRRHRHVHGVGRRVRGGPLPPVVARFRRDFE